MKRQLIHGDSVKELKNFDDNSVDLLCTDPPYGYGFMGRDWDKVLPDIKIFEECFRVLKPGSMAFVMSAPRSDVQYRMAEMLERVGFRIDYTPIYWTYASGFPKAMNIGKMIDKRDGNKREEVEDPQSAKRNKTKSDREVYGDYKDTNYKVTKGSSELEGSYGGFQPKPAVEVVIVAMKPLDKKGYLEQAEDNGKAVTWFDDCRIPFADDEDFDIEIRKAGNEFGQDSGWNEHKNKDTIKVVPKKKKITMPDLRDVGKKSKEAIGIDKLSYGQVENAERLEYEPNTVGRFPANLLVSDDILEDGKIRTAKPHGGDGKPLDTRDMGWGFKRMASTISDSGGYSRYYSLDAWWNKNIKSLPEPVQQTFPFMIVPKASRGEKDNGLEFMEEKKSGAYVGRGGSQDDPNGMFKDRETKSRNIHPTVKPLTLMNYLVVLGSRKGDVVLEPFAGSGTTALACVSQERDYIAIEREEEYYDIAKARLEKVEEPIKLWEKFS